jgi:hypothetical protein
MFYGNLHYDLLAWYPLPLLPEDVIGLIAEFAFDPYVDPW